MNPGRAAYPLGSRSLTAFSARPLTRAHITRPRPDESVPCPRRRRT
ncbi:hypothetical protein NKG94_48175 [Micromonospora sp. M12]